MVDDNHFEALDVDRVKVFTGNSSIDFQVPGVRVSLFVVSKGVETGGFFLYIDESRPEYKDQDTKKDEEEEPKASAKTAAAAFLFGGGHVMVVDNFVILMGLAVVILFAHDYYSIRILLK